MAQEKTLREVVKDSVKETKETSAQPEATNQEGISQEGETKAGDTPEYVSGIDISDIPADIRPQLKEKLSQKASLLEKGYQSKFQEISKFKKAQEELVNMGLTVDEAQQVLMKHIEQKRNPTVITEQKKQAIKTLDKLMEQSPYEQKATLEQMRQIILEETDVSELKKQLGEIQNELKGYRSVTSSYRQKEIEGDLENLTSKYGKEIIEKHKDMIVSEGLKYRIPTINLLFSIVPPDELEQAIISNRKEAKKPLTDEKRNAITNQNSSVTSKENIDIRKNTLKDIIKEVIKK